MILKLVRQASNQNWKQKHVLFLSSCCFKSNLNSNSSSTCKAFSSQPNPNVPQFQSDRILTIPNLLTSSRILATPFIGHFVLTGQSGTALTLFSIAAITDLVHSFVIHL